MPTDNLLLENEARIAMLEWLGADNYKSRVLLRTFIYSTSLGKALTQIDTGTVTGFDQWCRHRDLINKVVSLLEDKGWMRRSSTHLGRKPKRTEFDKQEIAKAMRIVEGRFHVPRTRRSAEYIINGPRYQYCIVTVSDRFFDYLANDVEDLEIEGLTRDEIAIKLGAKRSVVNSFVRHLRKRGWSEKKVRDGTSFKRILVVPKNDQHCSASQPFSE